MRSGEARPMKGLLMIVSRFSNDNQVTSSSDRLVTSIIQPDGKSTINLPPETQNRKLTVSLVSIRYTKLWVYDAMQ